MSIRGFTVNAGDEIEKVLKAATASYYITRYHTFKNKSTKNYQIRQFVDMQQSFKVQSYSEEIWSHAIIFELI